MDEAGREALYLRDKLGGVDPPVRAVHRNEPRAMHEEFRRAALVLDDVRFAVAEGDAARPVDARECQ